MKKEKRKLKRANRIGRIICLFSVLFLSLALGAVLYFGKDNTHNPNSLSLAKGREGKEQPDNTDSKGQGEISPQPSQTSNNLTVLLIGTDKRPTDKSIGNTDTLIVVNMDSNSGRTELLSVPRDTQVSFPRYGIAKINAIARLGNSVQALKTNLEELLGQPIDGYVLTNFAGFKDIINTLGGITVNVEKNMYYQTGDTEDGIINL